MKQHAKNYLIFGAGASGLSVVEYCLAEQSNVRVIDTREMPPNAKKIKTLLSNGCISFGKIEQKWIDQADVIVLSPGVSPNLPELKQAKSHGVEVIGDVELFARIVDKPYIAITGSNGKSTVTSIVADILESQGLKVKACANIGEPALSVVDDDVDIFVLELSSFQLETCNSLSPLVSVVLNVCDDHLDRHETIEKYAEIKSTIYRNAENKILPREEATGKYLLEYQADQSFGLNEPQGNNYGVVVEGSERWLVQGSRRIIRSSELPLLGSTGELNVLAALAVTQKLLSDEPKALDAIRCFKGLSHRCEVVVEHNGVCWIDDSKGTNVGATVSAIESINQSVILIVGGVYKGGSLDELCVAVEKSVSHIIAFGQDKNIFIEALSDYAIVKKASSMKECVEHAYQLVEPGQAVLFSPACASFDMFLNYIERGNAFKSEVLAKTEGGNHGG